MKAFLKSAVPAIVALSLLTGEASAAPPPIGSPAEADPPVRWYGWKILTATTALTPVVTLLSGAGFFSAGAGNGSGATAWLVFAGLGEAAFMASGPLVHYSHGHNRRALLSLAMMVGTTALGAGIGLMICDNCTALGNTMAASFGGFSGSILSSVLDESMLAYEPAKPEPPGAVVVKTQVLPWIDVASGRGVVGLTGTF